MLGVVVRTPEGAMRKRHVAWAGLAAIGLVGVLGMTGCAGLRNTITAANCNRITAGMTEREVEAVFGRQADAREEVLFSNKPTAAECLNGLAAGLPIMYPHAAYIKVWQGNSWGATLVARVTFTEEGRVTGPVFPAIEHDCWIQELARCLDITIPY
jgi:hypothetical protein